MDTHVYNERVCRQVLDVAGGKGELAFELLNLSNVPATVVDPRPVTPHPNPHTGVPRSEESA